MKATIEIDATPQEMRQLFGLPDVQSLQQEALEKVREKIMAGIESNDLSELMKLYMPMPDQLSVMEGFQKTMWDAMMKGVTLPTEENEK
ncbi:MAG: hypothetical protein CL866_01340 [Cycloclasticus sp.]|jgi:hypothetical protein|nr:hypothetical protein [Cycloclasticus sp.]MBG95504.1 hypothetical protein [Cycloclasticus sp.]|tara:strand:- start:527 stop:793 length:267 start_codon:yes stop_codon:yes gene_type:complete